MNPSLSLRLIFLYEPLISEVRGLPEVGWPVVAMGLGVAGLPIQKWEEEVEGWGSSLVGSRGAFVSITGSTESSISEGGTAVGLGSNRSVSEAQIEAQFIFDVTLLWNNRDCTYQDWIVEELDLFGLSGKHRRCLKGDRRQNVCHLFYFKYI